jgi:AraC-like DNA-binding protein
MNTYKSYIFSSLIHYYLYFKKGIILCFFFCVGNHFAQTKDTLLNTVVSKPFFYNILKGSENKLYAGTSQGIYEVIGSEIKLYSEEKGYLTTNQNGQPIIDANGIKFHRSTSFSHLLPYPEMGTERSYYAGFDDLFYLCSGGRLYIFDIIPYQHSYKNHSIRSISKNFVGTYSGVYLNGKKLLDPAPSYTDSYVRQIGNRGFICSYPLYILEKDAMETGILVPQQNFFQFEEPDGLLVSDIMADKDNETYFIATQNKLIWVDDDFKVKEILFEKNELNNPIQLVQGTVNKIFFTTENQLFSYHYNTRKIKKETQLDVPIKAAVYLGDQIYLLTQNSLYRYNSEEILEFLTNVEQAHSLLPVLGDQLMVGTDLGLYNYNLVTNILNIVIKNVEFNRGALYLEQDANLSKSKIHAGSINGIYTFELGKLNDLMERNTLTDQDKHDLNFTNLFLGFLIVVLLVGLWLSIRFYKTKLNSAYRKIDTLQSQNDVVTREQIESFIVQNLPEASIKSILDTFHLNAPQLYTILAPDKPGTLIQNQRMAKVHELRKSQKTIDEIASITGFSISYLKKL